MTYKLWTPEEENSLRELVATGKYSYRQIGVMMGRSINSVTSHARQYLDINNDKFDKRKYRYTEDFFKIPNILNCYIAGFLAADGCVQPCQSGNWKVSLEIAEEDKSHLIWIKEALGHEGPLFGWTKKIGQPTNRICLFVTDEYAKQLAVNFGVIHKKAHRLQPPRLDRFQDRFSYLLGLLDGDGCVHVGNSNNLSVGFTSASLEAVKWFESVVSELNLPLITNKTPTIRSVTHADAWHLAYVGARAVCLVQLAQEFARRHNLPILARKWNSDRLNQHISAFCARFPDFRFDPVAKLDDLIAQSPQIVASP